MNPPPMLPSDRQLLDAARRGDDVAWGELVQRHRQAVARVVASGRGQRRAVDAAIEEIKDTVLAPTGRDVAVDTGAPMIRAARPAMLAAVTDGFYGPAWPGVLTDDADGAPPSVGDDGLLAVAFSTLPEPWQAVLWHRHVDGATDADIAPHVGRDEHEVPSLLDTAERGLVDAFFREYASVGPLEAEAALVVPLLAGYHAGTLSPSEAARVDDHLRRDRIALAPDDAATEGADGGSAPAALRPPSLRRHDAVDSRRLLDLVGALDRRLAPAIAPGVTKMPTDDTPPAPVVPPPRDADPDPSRRRLLAAVAGLALVGGLAVVVWFALDGEGGGDGDDAGDARPVETVSGDPNVGTGGAGGGDGTAPDGAATTTTSLALRPDALGPLNSIEVVVLADGPQGFAPTAPEQGVPVEVTPSVPAPVFAGGSGTVDFDVVNSSTDDVNAELGFTLPRGIRFDAGIGAVCEDPDDGSPRCNVLVPAGGSAELSVRFLLETANVGRLEIAGDVTDRIVTPIDVTPDLVHSSVGRGGVTMVGNTVTRCSPGRAGAIGVDCDDAAAGIGEFVNRWDIPIEFVGVAPQFALFNSSSADVDLPDGAEIVVAHLYWSGDLEERGRSIPDDGRNTVIALGLPGGDVETIEAGQVVLGDVDATQYLGSNDVTELVRQGGSGRYTVANIQTVETQGSYGAWALVIVWDHPDEPRRQRLVTRPFQWVAPTDESGETYRYGVDLPVVAAAGVAGELDVFALEGELGFEPESLVVGGAELGGDNPFDSSISNDERRPDAINNLGVDIDTYALDIDASDGILPIRATSEQDGIRIAVLGLTVDLPR